MYQIIKCDLLNLINECYNKKKIINIFKYILKNNIPHTINDNGVFFNIDLLDNNHLINITNILD